MSTSSDLAPWHDKEAQNWLRNTPSWIKLANLVQGTLHQDPNSYPHQMRAACAMIIMIGRKDLWPEHDPSIMSVTEIVALARRQLTQVKQRFSVQARQKKELIGNPTFRAFTNTLDEEIRILEARVADPPLTLADEPPSSWQEFWSETFANDQ